MRMALVALVVAGVTGCAAWCPKGFGSRTDYPQVHHSEVHRAARPFSVNAYVMGRSICPRKAYCVAPDSVLVSSTNQTEEALPLYVGCPRAFRIGQKYQFSYHRSGAITAARVDG